MSTVAILATDAPPMRHNQRLSYEVLRIEAADAVEKAGMTQIDLAGELGRSKAAISRALNETGAKFASLQREIIEHLTNYRVEEEVTFRAVRKDTAD